MRRVLLSLALVLCACVEQPPERSPLPDVAEAVSEAVGCQINVGDPLGVEVVSVLATGAAVGILEEGDVIASVEGTPTATRPDLSARMAEFGPGETIDVEFERDGVEKSASVVLGENPDDDTKGMIGITVQTAFEAVPLDGLEDVISPSATARPIEIGGAIFVFDPISNQWQSTGVTPPRDTRWVSTSSGLYSATIDEPVQVVDLLTGEEIADDGFQDWEPLRLIGAVGDTILVVVTDEVPDQPGFVNLGIAGFEPRSGETRWVTPVSNGFGIPVAAYGGLDDTVFLAVGADPESGDQLGVTLFDADGNLQLGEGLTEYGSPIGWYDETSIAYRSSEGLVTVYDLIERTASDFELPQSLFGSVAASVGDGRHIIAVGNRDLLLQDLSDINVSEPLATNCNFGQTGDPGWGV